MNYCAECGDVLREREVDDYFCPNCNGIESFKGKYFKVELFESNSHESLMDKLNDVMLFGGLPLFESFNVVRSSTSHSLPHTSSTTETYHIFVAFEDKLHYENYLKLLKLEKFTSKKIGKKEFEFRYPPTVENPSPKPSYAKYG